MDSISTIIAENKEQILASASPVLLPGAINARAHEEIISSLERQHWKEIGHPDTMRLRSTEVPTVAREAIDELLSALHLAEATIDAYRLESGSYLLQHAEEPWNGIECWLMLAREWNEEARGEITYVDDTPLMIAPEENAIIIARRSDTQRIFIKHVSHHAPGPLFLLRARTKQ